MGCLMYRKGPSLTMVLFAGVMENDLPSEIIPQKDNEEPKNITADKSIGTYHNVERLVE